MVTLRGQFSPRARTKVLLASTFAALGAFAISTIDTNDASAKTPGSTYCFYGKCHRVKTLSEMQELVGTESIMQASFYDSCKVDRYNPCGLTSSGEQFHPDRADNAASPIYPDGTVLLVWSDETKQAVILRVNNAGPYWGARKLDVSRAAALQLGFKHKGVGKVTVRVLSAPTRQEATYRRNRSYDPVPGHIGEFADMNQAFEVAQALTTTGTAVAALSAPVGTYKALPAAPAGTRIPDAARPTIVAEASEPTTRPRLVVASKDKADSLVLAAASEPVTAANGVKRNGHVKPVVIADASSSKRRTAAKASKRVAVAAHKPAKTVRVASHTPKKRARIQVASSRGVIAPLTANEIISARFDRSIVASNLAPVRRLPVGVQSDRPKVKVAARRPAVAAGRNPGKYSSLSKARGMKVSDARDVLAPVTPSLTGTRPRMPVEHEGAIRPRSIPAGPFTALA